MRLRTAFATAFAIVVCMFVLQWWAGRAMERALITGWELPGWFRLLYFMAMLWKDFWPFLSSVLLVLLVTIALVGRHRRCV